ncbi:hypothetical protein ACIPPQ_21305 [Sphingopyxis sp. LARHCG72]
MELPTVDRNGVNLLDGDLQLPQIELTMGEGQNAMTYSSMASSKFWRHNFQMVISEPAVNWMSIQAGNTAAIFRYMGETPTDYVYAPSWKNSAQYFHVNKSSGYHFVDRDGTEILFHQLIDGHVGSYPGVFGGGRAALATKLIRPSGEIYNFYYKSFKHPDRDAYGARLQSVVSSRGYMLKFTYASNDVVTGLSKIYSLSKVTLINRAIDYCDPASDNCAVASGKWPEATYAIAAIQQVNSYKDVLGRTGFYRRGRPPATELPPIFPDYDLRFPLPILGYKRPNTSAIAYTTPFTDGTTPFVGTEDVTVGHSPHNITLGGPCCRVGSIKTADGTTSYAYNYNPALTVVTDPLGKARAYVFKPFPTWDGATDQQLSAMKDELGRVTTIIYSPEQRPVEINYPEGNKALYAYNALGLTTKRILRPKPGSGLADIVTEVGYLPDNVFCENRKLCAQPLWTRDAKGNQTDYAYDPAHGGLLTRMGPAPSPDAARPLTVRSYVQKYAYVKNPAGALVQSEAPIWMSASETVCQTAAGSSTPTCDGGAPQLITTYEYGADGTPNNLWPRGVAVTAGGETLRTCYGYDDWGRKISETKPAANLSACP